jgi:hypothetical protein
MQVKKPKEPPQPELSLHDQFRRARAECERLANLIIDAKVAADKASNPGLPEVSIRMLVEQHRTCHCQIALEVLYSAEKEKC